jgi:hypothetical protein
MIKVVIHAEFDAEEDMITAEQWAETGNDKQVIVDLISEDWIWFIERCGGIGNMIKSIEVSKK